MATIREGNRSVLLVVDVQKGNVASAYDRDAVVANIASAVAKARSAGAAVIWVQHFEHESDKGRDGYKIVPELFPEANDHRIEKRFNSCFEETGLEAVLSELGATRIVLVGAATNWCIRATAYGALDRGYDVCLISDAHTTESIELQDGRKIAARDIIDDLNVSMSWLSYPGRKNESKKAGEFSF
jgi:nicotinamidase-related amidase